MVNVTKESRRKTIWIIVGTILAGLTVFVGSIAYVVHRLYESFSPSDTPPATLVMPRVVTGDARFRKSVFYAEPSLGVTTDLQYGQFGSNQPQKLAIVTPTGASFVTADGKLDHHVQFAELESPDLVTLVDRGPAQPPLFLRHGSWSSSVALIDAGGRTLWEYSYPTGIDDAAAGDLEGDGNIEFAVGLNGGGGVRLLDSNGKEIWHQPDADAWHVEIVPGSGGNPGSVVNSNAAGRFVIRDHHGNLLAGQDIGVYLDEFALVRWGNDIQPDHIAVAARGSGEVDVLTTKGLKSAQYSAPEPKEVGVRVAATPIFTGSEWDFAVLVRDPRWDRSVVYVYDPAGKLIYEEIANDGCAAIGTMPGAGAENLMLGCRDHVWKYEYLH
jgi:hypothetical protein